MLLTDYGAARVAASLRLNAAAAGVPLNARAEQALRMAEAQAAGIAADSGGQYWRLVMPPSEPSEVPEPELLTTAEAAADLGVTADAVVKRIARGELPAPVSRPSLGA
jgi:hypothetical protein